MDTSRLPPPEGDEAREGWPRFPDSASRPPGDARHIGGEVPLLASFVPGAVPRPEAH
jgi:hypothetical protein